MPPVPSGAAVPPVSPQLQLCPPFPFLLPTLRPLLPILHLLLPTLHLLQSLHNFAVRFHALSVGTSIYPCTCCGYLSSPAVQIPCALSALSSARVSHTGPVPDPLPPPGYGAGCRHTCMRHPLPLQTLYSVPVLSFSLLVHL